MRKCRLCGIKQHWGWRHCAVYYAQPLAIREQGETVACIYAHLNTPKMIGYITRGCCPVEQCVKRWEQANERTRDASLALQNALAISSDTTMSTEEIEKK